MFTNYWKITILALVAGTILLTPGTSDAQRRRRNGGANQQGWENAPRYTEGSRSGNYDDGAVPSSQYSFYPDGKNPQNTGGMRQLSNQNDAGFIVRLPDANAEVWFENQKTQQRGMVRQFESDALQPNQTYTFNIRARWMQDGRQMDQTKEVQARAGQNVTVNFNTSDREQIPNPQRQKQNLDQRNQKLGQNTTGNQNSGDNPSQP